MHLFRLVGTYEFFLEQAIEKKLIRVEIFAAVNELQIFRTRIWLQNTYNLYPTFLNLGDHGDDLRQIHSSDQLNMEITTLVAETPEWITGIRCGSETIFLELIQAQIKTCIKE